MVTGRMAVLFAWLGLLVPARSVDAQLRGDEVKTVYFQGNETFSDDLLARAIVTKETACRSFVLIPFCWLGMDFALRRSQLREQEIPRDQARLMVWYYTRGFRDVQVDTPTVVRRPGILDVVFEIVEGRPVLAASIAFEGAEALVDTGLLEDLPVQAGDRLSTLARDATKDTLTQRLKNQGYAHADVFHRTLRPIDDPYNAEVAFEIVPGPRATYGAIDIQGIDNLSQGTVLRTLRFNSGDVYRDSDIEEASGRLFGLDIIRSAQIVPDLQSVPEAIVPVTVLVQEGDAYRVRAGGGWSTAECLNLEARWGSRNFLGGGRILQIRGRLGNLLAPDLGDVLCNDSGTGDFARATWLAAVDLAQPWIFSTDNSLAMSVFVERQTLPDIFIRRALGFRAALTRTLDPETALTFFYRPELSELDAGDILFCTGFLVCTPEDIALLEGANRLAPIGIRFTRDRSDDLLNPRSGYRLAFDVEHAAALTGSNFRYDRAVAEAVWYGELTGPVVLATRLRAGWVGSGAFDALVRPVEDLSIIHPQRRFFAGGANSVRGFSRSRLGPRVLIAQPVQLLSSTSGVGAGCTPAEVMDLSCDAGVAERSVFNALPTGGTRVIEGNAEVRFPLGSWLQGAAFTDFGQAWSPDRGVVLADIEFTPGFGVRFPSPVGPIRVDLAYRFRGEQELPVITRQIQAFDPVLHDIEDQLLVNGARIPFVQKSDLVPLGPRVTFLDTESRFQLHVSIGQAF